jgi:hypothetical protein
MEKDEIVGDQSKSRPSPSWIEAQLVREMAQVKAPEGLWTRIRAEQSARKALPRTGWMLWPVVATVMLVASGDLLWQSVNAASGRPRTTLERTLVRAKAPQAMVLGVSTCRTCHLEPGLY